MTKVTKQMDVEQRDYRIVTLVGERRVDSLLEDWIEARTKDTVVEDTPYENEMREI